jgi:hypothetical protein
VILEWLENKFGPMLTALDELVKEIRKGKVTYEGEAWLVDLRVSPCTAAEVEDVVEVECVLCVRVTAFPEEYLPDPDSPAPRADWADREALEVVS